MHHFMQPDEPLIPRYDSVILQDASDAFLEVQMRLKRTCSTVTCDVCGNVFMQLRWWQTFCSQDCRRKNHVLKAVKASDALLEVRQLREEVDRLRSILNDNGIQF